MSQNEFESRKQQPGEETYQPQYPYTWSGQSQREGMPRDEPPLNYAAPGQSDFQHYASGQQVPWWARPQQQQNGPLAFAAIVALVILITLILGALGIVGVVLGSIGHILGVILGAILLLIIFVFLFVFLILGLIWRVVGRALRPFEMYDPRMRRQYYRRMARGAARRFWRGPW